MDRKKFLLGILIFAILLAGCVGPKAEEKVEIPIGVLVDLSGSLATYGEDIKVCTEIAMENINKYFESKGQPYRVKLYVEDTRADPKIALEKTMALYGKGVKMIIGPMGSGEVKNIFEYVTSNKIIIVSPSSTAIPPIIGVTSPEEKKYVFRFVATDDFQTKAIAKEVADLGIKAVVITYIGNAWGKGLEDVGVPEFEKLNIEVGEIVEYPDPAPTDFTPYIATMEKAVDELLKKYKENEIGIVAFSYEEVATMLAQVKDDSNLLKVTWIGCDGTAQSDKVLEICDKANKVKLYSTVFESKGKAYDELNKVYQEKQGKSPYQYGLDAYDAAWVLALAFSEVYSKSGKYDADQMAEIIPEVTEKYSKGEYGVETVTGYIKLNEYNDRASGDYGIYYVKDCNWEKAGTWKYTTNEIVWVGKEQSTPNVQLGCG